MAANVMSVAYNQLNAMYGLSNTTSNKYDAHKKSELRSTYNSIIKSNKESPLYRIKEGADVRRFAIDIKEQAHIIKNTVAALSEDGKGIESALDRKVASSNLPDVVTAEYIGKDGDDTDANTKFQMEVRQLATPQVNTGNFIRRNAHNFKPGSYRFDLNTNTTSYEFQFNVNPNESNETVQAKLRKLINNANIGLHSEILTDEKGTHTALQITSAQTGLRADEENLFEIIPEANKDSMDAVNLLGIDRISSPAENSSFLLNGNLHASYSNTFTVNNMFSVTLNGVSEPGQAAVIGFKPSSDTVADQVEALIHAYNGMIDTADRYSNSQATSSKLLRDVKAIAGSFSDSFEKIGLTTSEDGKLVMDRDTFTQTISSSGFGPVFDTLNRFRDALGRHAEQASINPMNYVDKVVVAYKNPGRTFTTPYITSIYSGMMVDRRC
ncbi:MAG: flagellar capping protein [bacterium]|nr:flagellar capping protein [bacterium]